MKLMQWKHRRIIILLIIGIASYLMLRLKTYNYYDFVKIPKVKVIDVWEFVADFSNMKYMNPTIVDFTILSESGNYEHWKYKVKYSENLSHWPYFHNEAIAHFDIKSDPNNKIYYINSVHMTCMFSGLFCLESSSQFKFTKNESRDDVLCEEKVLYQCPHILGRFCRREVQHQRNSIMNNLRKHFQ